MRIRTWLTMMLLLVVAGLAKSDEPRAVRSELDVVYRKVGDRELKLDLTLPSDDGKDHPAVLVIHGGAWRGGDKADVRLFTTELAKHGYVSVSPQYRFCPQDPFPAQVHDVKAAVRWVRAHKDKYHVDPSHIGAMGFSAGGHLALMLGVTGPQDGLEGEQSGNGDSHVQAVVNFFGPTDLLAPDIPEVCKPWVRDFLGGTPQEKPGPAKQASPLSFLSHDDAPILTFQGTKDPLVPFNQAIKLADKMTAAGVDGRVELMAGAGHGWLGRELKRTIQESIAFLDQYLKPAAAN